MAVCGNRPDTTGVLAECRTPLGGRCICAAEVLAELQEDPTRYGGFDLPPSL